MGRFVKGAVVVVSFPFSDLERSKRRPALVITDLKGNDLIFCMITKTRREDGYSIPLEAADFESGQLKHPSNIRPNRIFTAEEDKIEYPVGNVKQAKIQEVINKLIQIIKA